MYKLSKHLYLVRRYKSIFHDCKCHSPSPHSFNENVPVFDSLLQWVKGNQIYFLYRTTEKYTYIIKNKGKNQVEVQVRWKMSGNGGARIIRRDALLWTKLNLYRFPFGRKENIATRWHSGGGGATGRGFVYWTYFNDYAPIVINCFVVYSDA